MDPLSDMLADIRAEDASVHQAALEAPWRLRFEGGSPLTMVTVVTGEAALALADETVHHLTAGSTAIVSGPSHFDLVDGSGTLDRPIPAASIQEAPQSDPDASTVLIAGTYRPARARHQRLLRALPAALVLHEEVDDVLWLHSVRDALTRVDSPGGQAMLDRILDWGLVCTIGCWLERQEGEGPGWYRGALDPVAGPALEAIHRHPDRAWTVDALAARANVSRAHFAKRFNEVMAQPPLRYVTERRMELAADLLADPEIPVAAAAAAVGYRDPFAFSTAFKRHQGMSPRAYRSQRR
ncbi:AraC family transcriptional regulator [Glycomyces rhizosphaerae]|uniref:AraC family transcriptional regulator n=1 Tax=Glycomyces rhizosphaerae TaxID=2054422 RepID=A0ABV7Q170_9ACTN